MNFYMKVLFEVLRNDGLKPRFESRSPPQKVSQQKVDETKVALRELGLKDSLEDE